MTRPASPTDDPHWRSLYEQTRTAAAADAQRCLSAGPRPRLSHDLVAAGIARLEQAIASDPQPPPRACRRGCGWCCHQPVFLTAPEAVVIVSYLRATWNAGRLAELRSILADRIAARQALGDERARNEAAVACAFLDDDNACTIHAQRPLACRGYLSSSAEACAERYADPAAVAPPIDPHAHTAARAVLHGLSAALTGAGMAGGLGELHTLLLQLLTMGAEQPRA